MMEPAWGRVAGEVGREGGHQGSRGRGETSLSALPSPLSPFQHTLEGTAEQRSWLLLQLGWAPRGESRGQEVLPGHVAAPSATQGALTPSCTVGSGSAVG